MKFRSKAMTGMLALLTILSSAGCSKLKARDEMNKGVRSFKDSKYETAVEHFKAAVDLDPELTNAHLYLAAAYASQYQPGGDSPENKRIGEEAIKAYENVLLKDPGECWICQRYCWHLLQHEEFCQGQGILQEKNRA